MQRVEETNINKFSQQLPCSAESSTVACVGLIYDVKKARLQDTRVLELVLAK